MCSGYGDLFGVNNRQFPATAPTFNLPNMFGVSDWDDPVSVRLWQTSKTNENYWKYRNQPWNFINFVKLNINK